MARKVGLAIALLILGFVVLVATRPAHFRIARSAVIQAPPEVIFPFLADLSQWPQWSPWEKLDPQMRRTYSGPASGRGAAYAWSGNDKAGEGRMNIVESRPPEYLAVKLEFIKPFAATNQATFELRRVAAGTDVVWTMEGDNGFIAKAFSLFADVDALIGKDFAEGLSNLKRLSEAAARPPR